MQAHAVRLIDGAAIPCPPLAGHQGFRRLDPLIEPSNLSPAPLDQYHVAGFCSAAGRRVMTGRIGIVSRLIFAAFLLSAGLSSTAHAEKRVALVIGNSAYQSVPK